MGRPWVLAALLVCACTPAPADDGASSEDAITKPGDASPPWLYEGPMPALGSPRIVISITGHTLRISGTLPDGFDAATLPKHATQTADGLVHVVYPIATGKRVDGKWNNVPGKYDHLNVRPYRPNDPAATGKEHWGGFPFLNYHDARRFAMHGPIDFVEDFDAGPEPHEDWRLVRGRVSLGCNRMQGEHVLELTQMLGFDMHRPWTTETNKKDPKNGVEGKWIPADLVVLSEPTLDELDGAALDVDYPKDASVPPIPEGREVKVLPTWDANVERTWACAVKPADDPNRTKSVKRDDARFDGHYCERVMRQ